VVIGLGVPLHAQHEAAPGSLDRLGQLVEDREPGHLQPLAQLVDALMVVGLRVVDLLARGLGDQRSGSQPNLVI